MDLESGGEKYEVIVYAIDSGTPVRETATTTVTVNMIDVNNKPPTFNESTYLVYVSERAAIGKFNRGEKKKNIKLYKTNPNSRKFYR